MVKFKTITLKVNQGNNKAISLYKSFGFCIVSNIPKYYGDEDAYVMSLNS